MCKVFSETEQSEEHAKRTTNLSLLLLLRFYIISVAIFNLQLPSLTDPLVRFVHPLRFFPLRFQPSIQQVLVVFFQSRDE